MERFEMKYLKSMRILILAAAVLAGIGSSFPLMARPPVIPKAPPMKIKIPEFHVKILSCGLKVILLKDDDLPLASANLYIPGGNIMDPPGKEGLVGLVGESLRNGGAGKLSAEAFDEALEEKAATMEATADQESFTVSFKCLSGDLPDVLGLFADMLLRPGFDDKRIGADRANLVDSLNRLEDIPDNLTRVLFTKGLFGSHPYGRWGSPKSTKGLSREDILKFYREHYGPEGSVLAIAGKFNEDEIFQALEKIFAGWKKQLPPPVFADGKSLGPVIYFYPKEVSQVFIRYGVPGLKRHDPRDFPLQVGNYILGGSGFTSRLMRNIRSNRGLAYFVDSVDVPYNIPGVFEVIGGTRPDSVTEYLSLMFKVLGDYAKEGPTAEELSQAKQGMTEEYAYNFESSFSLVPYKASLDFHGYPDDYLASYRNKIKAVTREETAQAVASILEQKNWVMVVCGPAELEKELGEFGKVVKITDIFAPLTEKP